MIKLRSNNYRTSQRIIIARLDDWRVHQVALSLDTPHSITSCDQLDMVELTLQMCRYVSQEFSIENMGFPQHFLTIPESRMICHSPRRKTMSHWIFWVWLCQVMSSFCFSGFLMTVSFWGCYINCAAGGSGHGTPLLPRLLWGTHHHDVALRQGLSGGSTGRNEPLKSTGDWFLLA